MSDKNTTLQFTYWDKAFYTIAIKEKTTVKKFVEEFYRQWLIHLVGNVITNFFLVNKPKIINHLKAK